MLLLGPEHYPISSLLLCPWQLNVGARLQVVESDAHVVRALRQSPTVLLLSLFEERAAEELVEPMEHLVLRD
jgi:hypothetical protein